MSLSCWGGVMPKEKTTLSYQQRLLRVLSYIKKNLDEPLDLDQLAALAYFSPHHFHRIFTQMVGESVKQHVRRLKLERALKALAVSDESVTEISFRAGFNTLEAFSRAIKKHYHMSPTQVRATMQQEIEKLVQQQEPKLEIQTLALGALDLAYVRHIGHYQEANLAWLKLVELTDLKYVIAPKAIRIGFAYDHPAITPVDKCCYDACIAWQPEFTESGELGRTSISAGKYVMFVHKGSLETIDESYRLFTRHWLQIQERKTRQQHNFMWYKNVAMLTDPDNQITECYFPID